jgi:hypothetical protein
MYEPVPSPLQPPHSLWCMFLTNLGHLASPLTKRNNPPTPNRNNSISRTYNFTQSTNAFRIPLYSRHQTCQPDQYGQERYTRWISRWELIRRDEDEEGY